MYSMHHCHCLMRMSTMMGTSCMTMKRITMAVSQTKNRIMMTMALTQEKVVVHSIKNVCTADGFY